MTVNLKLVGLMAVISLGVGVNASAGPRYTYIEGGYVNIKIDDPGIGRDPDGDGWNIGGSAAVTDNFHLFAGYTDATVDALGIDVDYRLLTLGGGVNFPVSNTVDLVGRLAYVNGEAKAGGLKLDEDGIGISGGIRAMVTPEFELGGGISYVDFGGDIGSETSLGVGAVYNFTDMFAVYADGAFSSDGRVIGAGVRLYFGDR